jgi:hypothetical protein
MGFLVPLGVTSKFSPLGRPPLCLPNLPKKLSTSYLPLKGAVFLAASLGVAGRPRREEVCLVSFCLFFSGSAITGEGPPNEWLDPCLTIVFELPLIKRYAQQSFCLPIVISELLAPSLAFFNKSKLI